MYLYFRQPTCCASCPLTAHSPLFARSATCKTRHIRCDEKSPVCANCERLGLQCRPSERITYSSWSNINATDLGPSAEAGVGAEAPSGQRERRQSHNMSPFVSQSLRPSSSASVSNHVTLSETGLGEIGGESAALPDDAEISQWSPSSAYTAQTSGSNPAVLDDEKAHLLSTFRTGLATWMDIFDFEDTYQREVSRLALQSDLLLRCICAFTAKHLSLLASGDVWAPTASRYYGEVCSFPPKLLMRNANRGFKAVTLLIQALNTSEPDRNELTAVILLSSYEAIAESGVLHRSHYQGAMNLIRGRGISASSVGLDRVNFIIYVRHEITLALANEKPLQFDPSNWNIPPLGPRSTEDHMASYLMCLSGSTVNLIFRRSSPKERSVLIERVDDWFKRTNSSFQGTPHGSISKEGLQKVYFTLPTAGESARHTVLTSRYSHTNSPYCSRSYVMVSPYLHLALRRA